MMPSIIRRHTESVAERPPAFFSTDIFASRPHKSHMRRTATTRTPARVEPTKWTRIAPPPPAASTAFQREPEDPIYAMLRIHADPHVARRRMRGHIAFLVLHAFVFMVLSMTTTTPPRAESGALDWVFDMLRSLLMLINAFMFTDTAMVATAVPEYYYRLMMDIEELGS